MSIVLFCNYAGLGNKLFEIACAYSFSKRLNRNLSILGMNLKDPHNQNNINDWLIDRCHILHDDIENLNKKGYKMIVEHESLCCSVDADLVKHVCNHNRVIMRGYFQTDKYFKNYKNDILRLFRCPDDVHKSINEFNKDSYFIHVRLGDYLSHVHHFVDLSKYYDKCLYQIFEKEPEAVVHVFTNDIDKLHKVYPNLMKYNLNIINEQSQVHCLYMMAACEKGGICANSTFSWWGSYLNKNPNKQVFMPSQWFNPHKHLAHVNTSGLYYCGVTIVDVN